MSEQDFIRITDQDITEANRLSHSCPICASSVENNVETDAVTPVVCSRCQTLYHKACWEQNGGKCAILGCGHEEYYPYGTELGPRLVINYSDIPKHAPSTPSPNGRYKELKRQQRRLQEEAKKQGGWLNLVNRILKAFGWR
ncbi:MAG: hypothetical protein BMS9Abin02_0463 [Anaerolineae bacterium]|nr:MAG: hypothetical protein BMS9Abin02_0463 [Anaerolineae bacterium]